MWKGQGVSLGNQALESVLKHQEILIPQGNGYSMSYKDSIHIKKHKITIKKNWPGYIIIMN